MNELVELKNQNSVTLLTRKGLSKEESIVFAKELMTVSCAKNIKLMDGTMEAWERYLVEDLNEGLFDLDDFLKGLNILARKSLFNRIDYADAYQEAVIYSFQNKTLWNKKIQCPICRKEIEVGYINEYGYYKNPPCGCDQREIWETKLSKYWQNIANKQSLEYESITRKNKNKVF
jgi:hypothetical protein